MANPLKSYTLEKAQDHFRGGKQDHVDHLNRTINEEAKRRGLKWMISANGDVYLDFTFAATRKNLEEDQARQEAERQDWKRAFGIVA